MSAKRISHVTHYELEHTVLKLSDYVLLACLGDAGRPADQVKVVDSVMERLEGKVQGFIASDMKLDLLQRVLAVGGVPTFLLLRQGVEVDRLLGKVDETRLERFINGGMSKKTDA